MRPFPDRPIQISVIIPTWNRAALLVDAVRSVDETRITPYIIVVDDGSQDKTQSEISALACRFPLKYIRVEHAGYPGRCRNIGVAAAQTDWIAFLDSDDRFLPEKLSRQMDELAHTGLSLCHTRERWLRGGTEVSQSHMRHARRGDIFADAVKKCIVGPSTTVMRRELFLRYGGYREDLEVAEDYEFLLRLLAFETIAFVDDELIEKRAGLSPQLSAKYGHIEGFRIHALAGFAVDVLAARDEGGATRRGQGHGNVARPDGGPPPARPGLEALLRVGRPPEPRWGSVDPASVPDGKLALAVRELARKCRVYARGARKRGRGGDALLYEQAAREAEAVLR
ncbi:MAG: glycosyltransferase family 2 protein [Spirochaetaceae bacterium]